MGLNFPRRNRNIAVEKCYCGVVGEGEDLAFVSKAVKKRGGKDRIAKEVSPTIDRGQTDLLPSYTD